MSCICQCLKFRVCSSGCFRPADTLKSDAWRRLTCTAPSNPLWAPRWAEVLHALEFPWTPPDWRDGSEEESGRQTQRFVSHLVTSENTSPLHYINQPSKGWQISGGASGSPGISPDKKDKKKQMRPYSYLKDDAVAFSLTKCCDSLYMSWHFVFCIYIYILSNCAHS